MKPRFRLIDDEEILSLEDPEYLVDNVMTAGSIVLVHGDSGAGKTFLALDMSLSIASGKTWHGRIVKQGPVVYVAGEGQGGIKSRVHAWKIRHQMAGRLLGVRFLREAVNPLSQTDVDALLAVLRDLSKPPALVVIDTWSQCLAAGDGDENSARDATKATAAFRRICTAIGATVLIIHHEGHTATGRARGSSALKAIADTVIAMTEKDKAVTLHNAKQRDFSTFDDIHLCRRVVELGEGKSSCIFDPAAPHHEPPANAPAAAPKAQEVLRHLGSNGARYTEWRSACGLADSTFRRALKELFKRKLIFKSDDKRYHRVSPGGAADNRHRHGRQNTATGGNGGCQDYRHSPPHPYRGGGGGGDGGDAAAEEKRAKTDTAEAHARGRDPVGQRDEATEHDANASGPEAERRVAADARGARGTPNEDEREEIDL